MAGFLTALAGMGELAGDVGQGVNNWQRVSQQQSNRAAFNKALDSMGPEGEIFRQMRNAGSSPEAIITTMNTDVGKDIKEQYIQGQINDILRTTSDPMERAWKIYGVTQNADVLKDMLEVQRYRQDHPDLSSYRTALQNFRNSNPPNLDEGTKRMIDAAIASPDPAQAMLAYKAVEGKYFSPGMFIPKLGYVESIGEDVEHRPINIKTPYQYTGAAGGPKTAVPAGPPGESYPSAPELPSDVMTPPGTPSPAATGTPAAATPQPSPSASALPSYVPTEIPSPEATATEAPEEILGTPEASPGALASTVGAGMGGVGAIGVNPGTPMPTPTATPTPTPEPVMNVPPPDATIAATPQATQATGLRPSVKPGPGFAKQQIANRMVDAVTGATQAVKMAAAQLPGGLRNPMGDTQWSNYAVFKLGVPIEPHAAQFMALVSTLRRNAMQATVIVTGSSSMRAAARLQGIHIPQEHDAPETVLEKINTMQLAGGVIDLFNVEAGRMTEQQYFQRLFSGPLGPTDWKPMAGGFDYSPSLGMYRRRR